MKSSTKDGIDVLEKGDAEAIRGFFLEERGLEGADKALFAAVDHGDIERVRSLIAAGAKVNAHDKKKLSPLHDASEKGHDEIVRTLIEAGADVKATSMDVKVEAARSFHGPVRFLWDGGYTPLHLAAGNGHTRVVLTLLDAKAEINAGNRSNWTPLFLAARDGHADTVGVLLDSGADLSIVTRREGASALHQAAENGHAEVLRVLLEKGADVDAKAKNGWTALHASVHQDHAEVVKVLISAGADLNAAGRRGMRPLHIAAIGWSPSAKSAEVLLDAGADPNVVAYGLWRPIHLAAWYGNHEIAESLLDSGASMKANILGISPRMMAILKSNKDVVAILNSSRSRGV